MTIRDQALHMAKCGYMTYKEALELIKDGTSYNEIMDFYDDNSWQNSRHNSHVNGLAYL